MTAQMRRFLDVAVGSLFYDQNWHLYRKDGEFNATLLDHVFGKNVLCFFKLSDLVYTHDSGCAKKLPEDYRTLSKEELVKPPEPYDTFHATSSKPAKPACISCGDMGEYINGNHYKYCSNCRRKASLQTSIPNTNSRTSVRDCSGRTWIANHEQQTASLQTECSSAHETPRDCPQSTSCEQDENGSDDKSIQGFDPFEHDWRCYGSNF